ncbi:hypothetical protein IAE22_30445, partial [Bacillus sp. S34]|nr:hypothetical protein [Bacillus sp. S34]
HYGSGSDDEYALIKEQLEDTGLFRVDLQSASWDTYVGNVGKSEYPVFQLGFFQDYPDASSYLTPAYGSADVNLLANNFDDTTVQGLVEAADAAPLEVIRRVVVAPRSTDRDPTLPDPTDGSDLAFTEPSTQAAPLALTGTVGTPFSHTFHTTGGTGTVAYAIQDAPSAEYSV